KLIGQRIPLGATHAHLADHVATSLPRGHGFEQVTLAIKHTDARGPTHLVAAKGEEVHTQRLHVYGHVRHALRPVKQHLGPTACAAATNSCTGLTVPKTLETCTKLKSLVAGVNNVSSWERSSSPASVSGI